MSSIPETFDRLHGLPHRVQQRAQRAQQCILQNDHAHALALLDEALVRFPTHPELLRLRGLIEVRESRAEAAIALFRRALQTWPEDGLLAGNLGAALAQHGDLHAAQHALERATRLDPTLTDAWLNLARVYELGGDAAGAETALSAVLELDPTHRSARILRADALKTLGRIDEADSELRAVLREAPDSVAAWVALVNLKSFRAGPDDLRALERLYASNELTAAQRIDVGFAFAQLLEAAGDYRRAFEVFTSANAEKRKTLRWDAAAVSGLIDRILEAFARDDASDTSERGAGVVLLVGMPRSGSTLAEQILAAHPRVRAGGETGLVAQILQQESQRRGVRFPAWISQATDADWQRLGKDYLARIATPSETVFTDKTPTNWQTLGAIRRMLPAARVVHCRRDALETAWSCYKHHFARDQLYSYETTELAAYFGDEQRAMRFWSSRHPTWIHAHRYETLLADPRKSIEALLAHCGLEFDPACLRFHEAGGEVRTASAAQVRRPLQRDTAVTPSYGALLDPLRALLEANDVV
ncbi:MAG: tetratricopeptide repeat-containing sulfotransferase family protein [Rhodanobacteraceae bacterium]